MSKRAYTHIHTTGGRKSQLVPESHSPLKMEGLGRLTFIKDKNDEVKDELKAEMRAVNQKIEGLHVELHEKMDRLNVSLEAILTRFGEDGAAPGASLRD